MANVSRVNGLRPVQDISGAPWNGQILRYYIAASDAVATFQGDLMTLATFSDAQGTPGARKFVIGTDTASIGAAVGFSINPLNLNSPQYRPASTAAYVYVPAAPDTVYEVQIGNSLILTDFNQNATVADAGGSTVTGQSGQAINAVNNTATTILKILGASLKQDNDITSVNAKALVMINNHQYNGTGTAGV